MTRVVNIRYDKYDQYIGRAGKGQDGYFGNRHPIGFCKICNTIHNREECILAFKKDFDDKINTDKEFKDRVLGLRGKILGCFCAERGGIKYNNKLICHGQIYKNWLDNL